MIVHRSMTNVKRGRMEEIVTLIKAEDELYPPPHERRICWPQFGPWQVLVLEWEFEDMAEQQAWWAGWTPSPSFWDQFNDCSAGGGTIEIWNIAD